MGFLFDDAHDWFRLVILLSCLLCTVGLVWRYFNPPTQDWNSKTKDYWFSLVMWSVAGSTVTLERLITNEDYNVSLVFIFGASLVCLNGLRTKGAWGNREK